MRQTDIVNRLDRNGIKNYAQLIRQQISKDNPTIIFETHQIYHTFPGWLKNIYNKTQRNYVGTMCNDVCIGLNLFVNINNITTKQIRDRISEGEQDKTAAERVMRAHNIELNSNPFVTLRANTNETYLRSIQYKILLNVYPTKKLLFKWGLADSNMCACTLGIDTITHSVWECTHAQQTWINLGIV